MDTWLALLVGALVGAPLVALLLAAARRPWTGRALRAEVAAPPLPTEAGPGVPAGVPAVLAVLRQSAVLVDPAEVVLHASVSAYELGLVRGDRLFEPELADLVREVRRDGVVRESELVLAGARGSAARYVGARVAALDVRPGFRLVVVLVEDRTRERRVEAVRRDFTVNVSHELKTPVGALALLAEAVAEAADDAEAVQRFAGRMQVEAERLGRLVQQVVELSRLQDDQLLEDPVRVEVAGLVAGALDRNRIDADLRSVQLVGHCDDGLAVRGNPGQLAVALGNLVDNAVTYSADGTRVAVTARQTGDVVQLTVSDQGIGISEDEQERIFERFYRVDPARARTTGGTGLGLSIVKHIAASHGGEVRVWSVERAGSSFTLVLPAWEDDPARPRTGAAARGASSRLQGATS